MPLPSNKMLGTFEVELLKLIEKNRIKKNINNEENKRKLYKM